MKTALIFWAIAFDALGVFWGSGLVLGTQHDIRFLLWGGGAMALFGCLIAGLLAHGPLGRWLGAARLRTAFRTICIVIPTALFFGSFDNAMISGQEAAMIAFVAGGCWLNWAAFRRRTAA